MAYGLSECATNSPAPILPTDPYPVCYHYFRQPLLAPFAPLEAKALFYKPDASITVHLAALASSLASFSALPFVPVFELSLLPSDSFLQENVIDEHRLAMHALLFIWCPLKQLNELCYQQSGVY